MGRVRSFFQVFLRYVVRVVAFAVVCGLVGFGIGYYFGSGDLGAFAGAVIGVCLAFVVPGRTPDDGMDRARHTATIRGHDGGGSIGSGGGF